MKCINTRGCYNKDAIPLAFWYDGKYIVTHNFCSEECYLIYIGEHDPPKKEHQTYADPEKQLIHDIYFRYYCEEKEKKPLGVKPGTQRGSYKKPKLVRSEKRKKELVRKKKHRERNRRYRERKKSEEIERKQKIIIEGV